METLNLKTLGIGTKEKAVLRASQCVVENVEIELIGEGKKTNNKAIFSVKHPDRDEPINISSVIYISPKTKKVTTTGTWFNLDEDKLLAKNSALATCLQKYGAANVQEMIGKSVFTEQDDSGYLAIKAY